MQNPDLTTALGRAGALQQQGRLDAAAAAYADILAKSPQSFEAAYRLGVVRLQTGDFAQATANFQRAVALNPKSAEAFNNLGTAFGGDERHQEALAAYDRALALTPDYRRARENRAKTLYRLGHHAAALSDFDAVLAARPEDVESHNTRGQILSELRRFDEARASFRRAMAVNPEFADAHWNLALTDLITGNFADGWRGYEWRWRKSGHRPVARTFREPLWTGIEPLTGCTILLHAEQGYGDAIQFSRYAKLVAQKGGRVALEMPAALADLARSVPGVAAVAVNGQPLPAFDFHCPLMSLPRAFATDLESIPADIPYLTPDPAKVAAWQVEVGAGPGLRIGLVWSGSTIHRDDRRRSIPLARLLDAMPVGATLYGLQKEIGAEDRALMAERKVNNVSARLADFSDTAALASLMDLVITVDTSVAHLAGALGVKTLLILAYANDWRWLTGRTDSPWYPTMRLFRQPAFDDWGAVIAAVKGALAEKGN